MILKVPLYMDAISFNNDRANKSHTKESRQFDRALINR